MGELKTRSRIALAFVVVYGPFLVLLFFSDGAENWRALWKLSPILPSISIHALTGIPLGSGPFHRWELTALFTLIWIGGVILGFIKLRRALWPFAVTTTLISSFFVWIVLQLLKA